MRLLEPEKLNEKYEKTSSKKEEILANLNAKKITAVQRYLYTINSSIDCTDKAYKSNYNYFYKLKPIISGEFNDLYFELMKKATSEVDKQNVSVNKVIEIADSIKKIAPEAKKKFYPSFSTKLLHTINHNYPIYDSKVWYFFCNRKSTPGKDEFIDFYEKLVIEYERVTENKLLNPIIEYLNENIGVDFKNINPVKKIDFIIWQYQKIIDDEVKKKSK